MEGNMRILIVEDDKYVREYLYSLASKAGECDTTVNGVEALDAYSMAIDEGKPYDLILLDIMMPVYDGEKVLKTIRRIEKKMTGNKDQRVKVIIASALNDDVLRSRLEEHGFDEYLTKPINTDKLVELLNKYKN